MKKALIKITVFVLVFFLSLIVIGRLMNKDNNNLTMDMAPASLPVVTMEKSGIAYNQLHGFVTPMDTAFQRETVTELDSDRSIRFSVDTYGVQIDGIHVQVRSIDGERLIEDSQVTELYQEGDQITAAIALKDLIEQDTEYMLVILLETQERGTIRYYTRIVLSENTYASQKLAFVKEFHETLYDKELAREKLSKYLEPDATGDNTTLHRVNIHSSFHQITWGDLPVTEETAPVIQMTELASQTASVLVNFIVSTPREGGKTYYMVQEFFRVRLLTNADRLYLLEYDRTMTQIPDVKGEIYKNDKLLLGIVDENTPFLESEDGNIVVFEVANQLLSYHLSTNQLTVLFSFYDSEHADPRTVFPNHSIKVWDVDEGGNVQFAVYGYMNRGRHEGEVGIQIYDYDSALNTIEEIVYIPSDKSYALLRQEMDQLLYVNRERMLYLFLDNTIFEVDTDNRAYREIATLTQDDVMKTSDNHRVLAWQEGEGRYGGKTLIVKNLGNGTESRINAPAGESIRVLGFMGEDVIYGLARDTDIVGDEAGQAFFPMYRICISNASGELLKDMTSEGIFITDCQVEENQITLLRMERREDGSFYELAPEYIMTNQEPSADKNKLVVANIDLYQKYVQIQTRVAAGNSVQVKNPKEVVFEGGRSLTLQPTQKVPRYYVYYADQVSGIYTSPAEAVASAYEQSGVVINNGGECIWLRGNRVPRNQIMAITENKVSEEKNSLAVCLEVMLQLEGVVQNTSQLLEQGQSPAQILENGLEDVEILELTGCPLDAVLYYVNQDIPVLAQLSNGEAVLVTGFNELNVVIMDPRDGSLAKKGMNDSAQWFAENGNRFLTYIPVKD